MRGIYSRILAVIVATAFAILGVVGIGVQAQAETADPGPVTSSQLDPAGGHREVTFCHASAADTNAYGPNAITADGESIIKAGHGDHTGPIWQPGLSEWGDIIPPFQYSTGDGTASFPGLNWTVEGRAIVANNCQVPPVTATLATPEVTQSVCIGTPPAPSVPTLTVPANTASVSYTVSEPAPYAPGQSVTVTATAATGYWFGTANASPPPIWVPITATGWTIGAGFTTATYPVAFTTPNCVPVLTDVTATAPGFADGVCGTDGLPTSGSYTVPTVVGVEYRIGASPVTAGTHTAANGSAVTITAHALTGYRLTNTVTEWSHTFVSPVCPVVLIDATATAPGFANAVCGSDGKPTTASYTVPGVTGVEYRIGGSRVSAGAHNATDGSAVTITAHALAGYRLTNTVTEWSHTFGATPTCADVGGEHAVAVPDPTFRDAVCGSDGNPTTASYTVVARDHVYYRVAGQLKAAGTYPATDGSTVTIVASSDSDWKIVGAATFTHTFGTTPVCKAVLPEVVTPPLANTGAGPVQQEIAWAIGLVLAGAGVLIGTMLATGRRQRGARS